MTDYATKEAARTANAVAGDTIAGIEILSIHPVSGYVMAASGSNGAISTVIDSIDDVPGLREELDEKVASSDLQPLTDRVIDLENQSSFIPVHDIAATYAINDRVLHQGYEYKSKVADPQTAPTGWDSDDWRLADKHKQEYDVEFSVAANDEVDVFAKVFNNDGILGQFKLFADSPGCDVQILIDTIVVDTVPVTTSRDERLTGMGAAFSFAEDDTGSAIIKNVAGTPINVGGVISARIDL